MLQTPHIEGSLAAAPASAGLWRLEFARVLPAWEAEGEQHEASLARQPGRGLQHAGHLGRWWGGVSMQTALPDLQVAPYTPWGTLDPRAGPLVGRTHSQDVKESAVLQGVALAPGRAETAAGAGPGPPAEAAPSKVGRALELHNAHLQGSALAPGLSKRGLPAVGRHTVLLSLLGLLSIPGHALSSASLVTVLSVMSPLASGVLIVCTAPHSPIPSFSTSVWTKDGPSAFQHLVRCHDALWTHLPLMARFSQEITLGTLNVNVGKITPRPHLPEQPAKKRGDEQAPKSPLFRDCLLSPFAWE